MDVDGAGSDWVGRLPAAMGYVIGIAAVAGWLLFSAAHLHDRAQLNHVTGAWIGLAYWAQQGVLYPPLFDGEHYGGTRFGPLPIVLHAGLDVLTGDLAAAGKLSNILQMAGLLAVMVWLLHRAGTPGWLTVLLAGGVLLSGPGWTAGTSIRNDALAALLQVWALGLAEECGRKQAKTQHPPALPGEPGALPVTAAGVLAGLALAAKINAVWAAAAIVLLCVLRKQWGSLGVFVLAYGLSAVVVMGLFEWISQGRMAENLLDFGFAGENATTTLGPASMIRGAVRLVLHLGQDAPLAWALTPVALAAAVWAWMPPTRSIWSLLTVGLALLIWLPVGAVMFNNPGIATNHLLDLVVLVYLMVGMAWGKFFEPGVPGQSRGLKLAGAVVAVWLVGFSTATRDRAADWAGAATQLRSGRAPAAIDPAALRGMASPMDEVFSQDASIPVMLGQPPLMLDGFMLRRIVRGHPGWAAPLIERLDQHAFDMLILVAPLDAPPYPGFFGQQHFGPEIVAAIERNYALSGTLWDYAVYRPRP